MAERWVLDLEILSELIQGERFIAPVDALLLCDVARVDDRD
jgi:hypothetical protein